MRVLRAAIAILAIFASIVLPRSATAQDGPHFGRQKLHEFVKDPQKLQSLLQGVFVMKSRNSAPKDSALYRTSWEYWANIHGYPGTGPRAGFGPGLRTVDEIRNSSLTSPLFAGYFTGLKDFTPPDALAAEIWATCEHGTPYFFAWHRMYLYFFERVLRSASGDPNFALPYWDYTNVTAAPNVEDIAWRIPVIFTVPQLSTGTNNVDNPLYEERRTAGFGETVQIDTELTDPDAVLLISDFGTFQSTLDGGIHGNIHCALGNTCAAPYIGHVPFSANDPIFWHHHANIDRLWDCWMKRNGRQGLPPKDSDWMKHSFSFVDENGNKVSMKVSELFDATGRIDYTYDNVDKCFRKEPTSSPPFAAVASTSEASPEMKKTEIATASNVQVNKVDQQVPLLPTSNVSAEAANRAMALSVRPNALSPTRAMLRISNVQIEKNPGASVKVYLTDASGERKEFVGVLSFFDALMTGHDHGATERTYSFDVSAPLQRLLADRPSTERVNVALVPATGVSGGGNIDRSQYESAGLRIGEIKLEVQTGTIPLKLPTVPKFE